MFTSCQQPGNALLVASHVFLKKSARAGGVAQAVENLPTKHETLNSSTSTAKKQVLIMCLVFANN
jgi:hypothetical protein